MLLKIKNPFAGQCKYHLSTLAAFGAGLGAAVGYGLIPWYWLLIAALLTLFLNRWQLLTALAVFFICMCSGLLNRYINDTAAARIPSQRMRISGTLHCIDRRAANSKNLPPLKTVRCIALCGENEFEATVLLPENCNFSYSESRRFSGLIYPASASGLVCENGNIIDEIPPIYGNRPLLVVKEFSPSEQHFSIMKYFLFLRDKMLDRLLENIKNPDNAEMAAQLFFGAGNGTPPALRKNFIHTGTIHLFSVSGLHVTLVAGLILAFLRPTPFKWRYRIAALFTLFYVLCSGASLPAVRAGSMVIVWCLMRSFLIKGFTWDTMMVVWCIFALVDPASVGTISAQYSFGITAALLLLVNRHKEDSEENKEVMSMMAPRNKYTIDLRRKLKWLHKIFSPPAAALTAFAAGCGISLYRQSIFAPGSIPANILLIFITPLLFSAMLFKMFLGIFSDTIDRVGAWCMETIFDLLTNFTRTMAEIIAPLPISQPPLWSVILFYLLFFGALNLKTYFHRSACAIAALATVLLIWMFPSQQTTRVMIISYDSNSPALTAIIYPDGYCRIADIPDHKTALLAGKLLARSGVRHANVSFSSGTAKSAKGTQTLAKTIFLTVNTPTGKKQPTRKFRQYMLSDNICKTNAPGTIQLDLSAQKTLTCRTPDGIEITTTATDNGRFAKIKSASGTEYCNTLVWASLPTVWMCEIK